MDIKVKQKWANIEIDKEALEASKKDKGAFVGLTADRLTEAANKLNKLLIKDDKIYIIDTDNVEFKELVWEDKKTAPPPLVPETRNSAFRWVVVVVTAVMLIVGFIATAKAEEVNLLICRSSFPYGLPRKEAIDTFEKARAKLSSELNVRLRRTALIVKSCNLNSDWKELYWGRHFSRVLRFIPDKLEKQHRLNLAIVPGITDGPRIGMGGVASDICTESEWNAAVVAIPFVNTTGFDGLSFGPLGVAHEVAHLLGCDHDETPCNSMHPDPLNQQRNCGLTRFLPQCYSEVRECRASRRGR